jgi:N-acylneuraminate cytidylyltransferase
MTDNRVHLLENGMEGIAFNRSDGMGLSLVRACVEVLVMSAETNQVVARRCQKLDLDCLTGVQDKLSSLREWTQRREIDLKDVVYVGNDINDVACMRAVGLGVAVADAHPLALCHAGWILRKSGGMGAVREICDLLLNARGCGFKAVDQIDGLKR